eukprot:COSAG04_NODE_32336_length_251_cov_1.500000_1_plen_35_part_10
MTSPSEFSTFGSIISLKHFYLFIYSICSLTTPLDE